MTQDKLSRVATSPYKYINKNKNKFVKKNFLYKIDSGVVHNVSEKVDDHAGDLSANGVNSVYLGRHVIRNGDRPQTYSKSPDPISEFYESCKSTFIRNDLNVSDGVVMSGCFRSNKETLQRTMIPEIETEYSSLPDINIIKSKHKAIKAVIRKLDISMLDSCEADDMFLSKFRWETYPGFHYKEYFRFNSKLEAFNVASHVAEKRWNNIINATNAGKNIKRNEIFPSTYTVGARNKKEAWYENGETITSRAVHMPEYHSELQSAPWLDQITNLIKSEERGPIYIGNSYKKYKRLIKDIQFANTIIEGDVKRFDASLYINDIIIAIAILRLYYKHDDLYVDNHFLAIFDNVGIKDYYTPGGYIYRMYNGIPSGVKSTSLLGSIINLLNLCYGMRDYNLKKTKFIIGGDDFLISSEDDIKDDVLDTLSKQCRKIGYEFKLLELKKQGSNACKDMPTFYKYSVHNNEPVVLCKDMLSRVFLPQNKKYKNNVEIIRFLNDIIPSLAAPRSCHLLFYMFYKKMYKLVTRNDISLGDVLNLHKSVYEKVMQNADCISEDKFRPLATTNYLLYIKRPALGFNVFNIFKTQYSNRATLKIK